MNRTGRRIPNWSVGEPKVMPREKSVIGQLKSPEVG
jgi:hypothetical protein